MITKTEKLTEMSSMKLSEAQELAKELMYEYKARHQEKEAELNELDLNINNYEEYGRLQKEEFILFMLEHCCLQIWVCRRRSTKMMSDLWEQIIKAEEVGLEIL